MRSYSVGGTRPPKTSASVPRLIPLYSARTTTSPGEADGRGSVRISPRPGSAIQKARASFIRVNSGAFARHVTIPGVDIRVRVAAAGVAAGLGVAILATLGRRALPAGDLYALRSASILAVPTIIAILTVRAYHPFDSFGPANWMTMARAGLVALVSGLVGEPPAASIAASAVAMAIVVEVFDGVDGWLARRSNLASAFGARFDMEVDALLIMALAILAWQHGKAGSWVLLSGLLRYAFVIAGWLAPWIARPLPPSRRRQTICVVQISCLCAVLVPVVPVSWSAPVAAAALVALAASFLVDIVWLWRGESSAGLQACQP